MQLDLHKSRASGRSAMQCITFAVLLLVVQTLPAQAEQTGAMTPQAGVWKTWVIASGREFRLPPPPDQAATANELDELASLAVKRDRAALDRVAYWDTGAPSYRWSEIAVAEHIDRGIGWPLAVRNLA